MNLLKEKQKYAKRLQIKKDVVRHEIDSRRYENMTAEGVKGRALKQYKEGNSIAFCRGYIEALTEGNKYLRFEVMNRFIKTVKSKKRMNSFFSRLNEEDRVKWTSGRHINS